MKIDIKGSIDRGKWLNALHVKSEDVREHEAEHQQLMERLDIAEKKLLEAATPKATYRIMRREDVRTEGFSIEKHLEGCHKAAVIGVTLGAGVDELIRKTQITDMAMAVILDCGASVLTEHLCDDFEAYVKTKTEGYFTPRFSPGYGDYPLHCQKEIVRYIDGQRQIGLNVTADSLMIPRKSVTALMGIAEHPVEGRLATCGECVLREKCTLRKEGKLCSD